MADVAVSDTGVNSVTRGVMAMVWVTPLKGYCFFIDSGTDLAYRKTTDGGQTWAAAVDVFTGTVNAWDVWYDQWTPGDTGRNIHICYMDSGVDDVEYIRLNTDNDTMTGAVDIFAGATVAIARGIFCSIAKMRGGNLYCAFDMDAGAEKGLYRSTDEGVTWAARTDPVEATLDQCFVFPGNESDPNDCWLLYHDADVDLLTLKVHDDSANANYESATISSLIENGTDTTGQYGFSGAIRHMDNHLIIALFTEFDAVTADFRVFDITNATTITELTAIATDKDDMYYPGVFIENKTNHIYVFYVGKSDGSETLLTSANVYFAKSTNDGLTWSVDNLYSGDAASDWGKIYIAPNGPRLYPVWCDISTNLLRGNFDNSKTFDFPTFNNFKRPTVRNSEGMSVTG